MIANLIWTFLNGAIWPLVGVYMAYKKGDQGRRVALKKYEEAIENQNQAKNEIIEAIERGVDGHIDDIKEAIRDSINGKIGAEGKAMIDEIQNLPEYDQLLANISPEQQQNVTEALDGSKTRLQSFADRMGSVVGKGLLKRFERTIEDYL
jgi:vacuolar-type H+-ATPase subunit E/Vma4